MQHRVRLCLLIALGFVMLCSSAEAKKKHHHGSPDPAAATPVPEPAAWPIETAPKIDPAAPPSQSLQGLVERHLVGVLAPLGDSAFDQPEFIASYKAVYTDGLAAAPANHKAAYQLAIAVCDAMSGAVTERQNAVSALRGALATQNSEENQPRGGRAAGREEAREDNNFFLGTMKNNWVQRAGLLRNNVTALCLREREAERQVTPWFTPAPTPVPMAAAPAPAAVVAAPAPTPVVAASAPAPAAPTPTAAPGVSAPAANIDPLVGRWTWSNGQLVTLDMDGRISGQRHGSWRYLCTTDGGRNYEFNWAHRGWHDDLVLGADGKNLDGKDQRGQHVTAARQ